MRARAATLAAILFAAAAARASRTYPAVVAGTLSLPYVPACSLCHVEGKTGAGTAETPFARSMRARGLEGSNDLLVAPALDALGRDGVDSDGDGVADIQELLAGTDPNVAGGTSLALRADPGFGCTSGPPGEVLAAVAALAALRALRRKRLGRVHPLR